MPAQIKRFLIELRSSFWFLPGCLLLGALVISYLTAELDLAIAYEINVRAKDWSIFIGPEGARALLNTLAGSMITIASLVFSLTLIALTMAASSLGPRIIGHFMRDRITQLSLGVFLATFVYAVMTLLTVRDGPDGGFVPYVSLLVAIVLAILAFGWLIFFVNRVAQQIQADNVVAWIAADMEEAVDQILEASEGEIDGLAGDVERPKIDDDAWQVRARRTGYIQHIEHDRLLEMAEDTGVRVVMLRRPGHFVVKGQPVAISIPGKKFDDDADTNFNRFIVIGRQRTLGQDVEFAVMQMVDVGVRALSPGINDYNTAVATIDRLTGVTAVVFGEGLPGQVRFDSDGEPRLWLDPITYAGVVGSAFNEIRQCARGHVPVLMRLIESMSTLAGFVQEKGQRKAIQRQAEAVVEAARQNVRDGCDLREIEDRYEKFEAAISDT